MRNKKESNDKDKNGPFKGKNHSFDSIRLISKNHAKHWKGKTFTPEHRAKIACSRRVRESERSIRYHIYNLIVKRDMNTCRICKETRGILRNPKKRGGKEGNLIILHKDDDRNNLSPANLLTICCTCLQGLNK